MSNILIVENDKSLQKMIAEYFRAKNYHCETSETVEDACDKLEAKDYDLIILDRILDDGDGIEVVEYINDFNYKTRVIILSEKSKVDEKIAGLENGADDYLAKPFSISELYLRVKNLLDKQKVKQTKSITIGNVKIFPKSGEVIINEKRLTMRKKEMQILACLFKHKNQVVSRKMIIDDVWSGGADIPTHTTLDVYIRRIRIFLQSEKRLIKTIRGFGYMASLAE